MKLDAFEIDFDKYNVKIIIVAPKIKDEVLEMFDGLFKYEVNFLEIKSSEDHNIQTAVVIIACCI